MVRGPKIVFRGPMLPTFTLVSRLLASTRAAVSVRWRRSLVAPITSMRSSRLVAALGRQCVAGVGPAVADVGRERVAGLELEDGRSAPPADQFVEPAEAVPEG